MSKKPKGQKAIRLKAWMQSLLFALFAIALSFLSCKQSTDSNAAPGVVQAQILESASYLPANVDEWYTYRVLVSDTRYLPDSVRCDVTDPNGRPLPSFMLYDDGSAFALSTPAYASPTSQDIAAHDGQYTRAINSHLLADSLTGNYRFAFRLYGSVPYALDNDGLLTVSLQNAGPCLIVSYPHDSVFAECFAAETLTVHVAPTEADQVDSLRLDLSDGSTIVNQAQFVASSGDTIWKLLLSPAFFGCLPSAQNTYHFDYVAHTLFGEGCTQTGNVASFANGRPTVANSVMPDTAYRGAAPGDSNLIVATVQLHDCELTGSTTFVGAGNEPGVKFDSYRDGNPWSHGPDFFLRDDGAAPDAVAGDGIYSTWLKLLYSDSLFNNLYYFRFYAIDCAWPGDTTAFVYDSVRVLQPGHAPLAATPGHAGGRLGISVAQGPLLRSARSQ